ncbi:Anti-sigma regulatory factor (Ser/Thr protein kinase) [Lentzea californiensis]|nr:Anti-sigma regulatory factor (Ser/Thr protein kinase) [Lentzea californiensis]
MLQAVAVALRPLAIGIPFEEALVTPHGLLVLDLPVHPGVAVSALRRDLTAALRGLGEDHLYDVLLVMTELVSNALDHTPGVGRLRVQRSQAPCAVTVEVDDISSAEPVYGLSRLPNDFRGRGIVVVDSLARTWGTRRRAGGGKTVFASVYC